MKAETIQAVLDFRDQRDWRQFHTPKDLALSIVLEAAELLEVFQWSGSDVRCAGRDARVREELADVLCYCVSMADVYGFDLDEIILEKVAKNAEKYPARGDACVRRALCVAVSGCISFPAACR